MHVLMAMGVCDHVQLPFYRCMVLGRVAGHRLAVVPHSSSLHRGDTEMTKTLVLPNGALVHMERNDVNGFYTVLLRNPAGGIVDKTSCDTYRSACTYRRAFIKIAKTF